MTEIGGTIAEFGTTISIIAFSGLACFFRLDRSRNGQVITRTSLDSNAGPIGRNTSRNGFLNAEIPFCAGQRQCARIADGSDTDAVILIVPVLTPLKIETLDHTRSAVEVLETPSRCCK